MHCKVYCNTHYSTFFIHSMRKRSSEEDNLSTRDKMTCLIPTLGVAFTGMCAHIIDLANYYYQVKSGWLKWFHVQWNLQ